MYLLLISFVFALCNQWDAPHQGGRLNSQFLEEASGLIIDEKNNKLLHINDSGDGPFIYSTNLNGGNTKKKKIESFKPFDVEDMAETSCNGKTCFVVADIGDNLRIRSDIQLLFILAEEFYSSKSNINTFHRLTLKYPDGAHNAEGVAFDPKGDLFIVTKEEHSKKATNAVIYSLSAKDIFSKKEAVLNKKGEIPLTKWLSSYNWPGQIVTSFDISKKDSSWVLLTYENIVFLEPNFQVEAAKWSKKIIPYSTKKLRQAEAIAFDELGRSITVTTEKRKKKAQPIMIWTCKDEEKVKNSK